MRTAVLVDPQRVEIRDLPTPSSGDGEVLVRIREGGICGTDYSLFSGGLASAHLVRKRLAVLGSMIYRDEFPAAIDLLRSGEMRTELFISEVLPLDRLPEALENFRSPERVKTLIRMP